MTKRMITVAALQASFGNDMAANIAKVERLTREAVKRGAQVVLPPELFRASISRRAKIRNGSRPLILQTSILACWRCRNSRRS